MIRFVWRFVPMFVKQFLYDTRDALFKKFSRHYGDRYDVIHYSQREAEEKFFNASPSKIENILNGQKIAAFDVGARGGMESEWDKYKHLLDITLVEPDRDEAERLKAGGYKVIQSLVGAERGVRTLNIGERAGTSSILEPGGTFLDLYISENSSRFNVVGKVELPMTTVADIVAEQGGRVDYIKLDTQGSEHEIIKGFGSIRPLFIKTEISFVPLYKDSAIFFELGQRLYDMGYILFHTTYYRRSSPKRHRTNKPYIGMAIPIHGDAWFCADWTRSEGRQMIRGRERQYEALMNIFGLEDIYGYAFAGGKESKR